MKLDFPDETTIDQTQLTRERSPESGPRPYYPRVLRLNSPLALRSGQVRSGQVRSGQVTGRSGQVRSSLLLGRSLGP